MKVLRRRRRRRRHCLWATGLVLSIASYRQQHTTTNAFSLLFSNSHRVPSRNVATTLSLTFVQQPQASMPLSYNNQNESLTSLSSSSSSSSSLKSFQMELHDLAATNPQQAQDLLFDATATATATATAIQPDVACYVTVLEGWLDASNLTAARAVLDRMEQQFIRLDDELPYMLLIQAYANDIRNDVAGRSAEHAEGLLRHWQQQQRSSGGIEPSVKLYSMVLDGWCKRAGMTRGAIRKAEALLKEMESSISSSNNIAPNVLTYTSYIAGLARCKESDLARQAEAILTRMGQHGVEVDMVAYTSVLNCWSKAVSRRERDLAATRAMHLLTEMERQYRAGCVVLKPSLITYATAIRAMGNSLDPNAPQWVEDVLARMYAWHQSGVMTNLKPTTATYNAVLHALSQAPGDQKVRYARRAEQIVAEMAKRSKEGEKDVQPDVRTYAAVLRAWAQSHAPDAAENAQRVLDTLEDMFAKQESTFRPNFVCYTTVMGAWGSSRSSNALNRMDALLIRMENLYSETLEPEIRPNTVSYVTAIDAYCNNRYERDAARRAQTTVDRMFRLYKEGLGHVRPTRTVLNCLLNCYARSREKGSAEQAEKLFRWMESQYALGDEMVRPDHISLCGVLNAWANQGTDAGAARAMQIWKRMKSVPDEARGFDLTIMMPNIVIKAIARSGDPQAVVKGERILNDLEQDFRRGKSRLRPDVTTASSVINAAAYYSGDVTGRAEAWEIAWRTFQKIKDWANESPNNITFGTLFKAIANLMPDGERREELVRTLFDQACTAGQVCGYVLSQVRHASPQLYRDLVEEPCGMGGPDADASVSTLLRNIPAEWRANVVE